MASFSVTDALSAARLPTAFRTSGRAPLPLAVLTGRSDALLLLVPLLRLTAAVWMPLAEWGGYLLVVSSK